MLYEDYMVTDCGIRKEKSRTVYFCDLLGLNNHKINFKLIIQGCVGQEQYRAQHKAVAPYIHAGGLLHCEFAWQFHSNYLNLCLSGILPMKARGEGRGVISAKDYFNTDRDYWATTDPIGQWLRFPGVISCEGDAYIHTHFTNDYPQAGPYHTNSARGELVWKPKPEPSKTRRAIGRFFSSLVRA